MWDNFGCFETILRCCFMTLKTHLIPKGTTTLKKTLENLFCIYLHMEISKALCNGKISSCIQQNAKNLGFVQSKSHVKFSKQSQKEIGKLNQQCFIEPFMSSIVLNFEMDSSKKSNQNKYRNEIIVHGEVNNILKNKRITNVILVKNHFHIQEI